MKPYSHLHSILEEFLDNLLSQSFYWKRFFVAFSSWCFRMTTLTEDDLENKVPINKLGIYSLYCDKSQWSYRVGGVLYENRNKSTTPRPLKWRTAEWVRAEEIEND